VQGAAEQSLSRDTNRLGARLDFFRLVSFYFGGLGYYIGNFMTIVTIVFVVYFMLALAVSGWCGPWCGMLLGSQPPLPQAHVQTVSYKPSTANLLFTYYVNVHISQVETYAKLCACLSALMLAAPWLHTIRSLRQRRLGRGRSRQRAPCRCCWRAWVSFFCDRLIPLVVAVERHAHVTPSVLVRPCVTSGQYRPW
jgi:1,3-beta-glucan synthase component